MPTAVGMRLGYGPGRAYNGGIIANYVPAQKFVVEYATKHLKAAGCSKIEVGPVVSHPELSRAIIGDGTAASAASVTLTCLNKGNVPYTAYFLTAERAMTMAGSGMWWVSVIAGELCPADRPSLGLTVMRRMLDTFHMDPRWSENAAHTAGTISRIYKQGADAVGQTIVNGYWNRQTPVASPAAQRDPMEGFDDYIRGQQTVQDPDTGTNYKVGYGTHWINQQGVIGQIRLADCPGLASAHISALVAHKYFTMATQRIHDGQISPELRVKKSRSRRLRPAKASYQIISMDRWHRRQAPAPAEH